MALQQRWLTGIKVQMEIRAIEEAGRKIARCLSWLYALTERGNKNVRKNDKPELFVPNSKLQKAWRLQSLSSKPQGQGLLQTVKLAAEND